MPKKSDVGSMNSQLNESMNTWTVIGHRIVIYEDLNPHGTLFGGRLVEWIDESSTIYCMSRMKTRRIVTLRISELLFKQPVKLSDILEFRCRTVREGKTSLTIETLVQTILNNGNIVVCTAELQFVAVDDQGRATPWR